MPKLSVITVAYNSGKTIEDTILSVRAQREADYEHIIVDGLSGDNTMEIVDRYRDGFSTVVSEPDRGIYDAMNKGVEYATGDFVGFLNSDDYFTSPYALSALQRALDTSDADCAWGNVVHVDDGGRPRRLMSGRWFSQANLPYAIMPPHPTFYARKSTIESLGGFSLSYSIAADFDLCARLISVPGIRGVYVDEIITAMRLGGVSTEGLSSTRKITRQIEDSLEGMGVKTSWGRIRLRYGLKALEVLNGNRLALLGRRFPAGVWAS